MHNVENILVLRLDLQIDLPALIAQDLLQLCQLDRTFSHLSNHNHIKTTIHAILTDIHDVQWGDHEYFQSDRDDHADRSGG